MKTPVQTFTVTPAEAGQKLLQYLSRRLGAGLPQAVLQKFIRTGQVRLDGKRCKPFDRVGQGQLVRVPPYDPAGAGGPGPAGDSLPGPRPGSGDRPKATDAPATTGQPGRARPTGKPAAAPVARATAAGTTYPPLDILHEDDELLVVIKPAGLPVHPGSGHAVALTTLLTERYPDAPFRPTPAHRLDRDTTGLLLVAKSYRALRAIHEAMAAGSLDKTYLAWVMGRWTRSEINEGVLLRDRLAKTGEPGQERMEADADGKEAVSKTRLLFTTGEASLMEVQLLTGRTHQIRAQLSGRGHPVCGDAKYGGGRPPLLLHAWRVTLPGAVFTAPPPWPGAWAVKRPRRASLEAELTAFFSAFGGAARPDDPA